MSENSTVTACCLIIGNEVLSGRTKDANLGWLAERLTDMGIRMAEARVIPDVEEVIIDAVNEAREKYTYVFTTGGIGPTHDDITSLCVAKAFGVEIYRNPEAKALLESFIPVERLNEARLKMADVPVGSTLIENPVSKAPGFQMGNVYVMAGVPSIMRAMFDGLAAGLVGGKKMESIAVASYLPEGTVAAPLGEIQDGHPNVEIGSYPFFRAGNFGCTLISRGTDMDELEAVAEEVRQMIIELGGEPINEDLITPAEVTNEKDY
ncbi:MAG: competence/damage-inducible protein A [Rhodospirillaceae bacterium]|jgi:molybdenum cofactor synthesis domain-containing protein|nr:competence/damage-inducible protein A [Rhodospirillaceae bacterium]MBT4589630.1 competence/damage-inducible protein A [Rhodospirillaceae bacterium]MBT4941019.1 competence/damage-inducible protein A [Rhodospirillaceae bacterium]MBT5940020.1 competence/damage-inducible protein A [Rhodospirillaceae bacterium]MBT7269191.1 competence/damage-inducible protein A [Rhodospirillaceae bacterium]